MIVLNDRCSCAAAGAARARPATIGATNILTSSSSMCAVFPGGAPLRKSFALHRSRDLLPPSAKEATHELGRLVLADAAIDFRPMHAGRAGKIPHPVFDRSTLAIGRPEIEAPDARERDCCRAHGAGLERHVEIAIEQPFVAEGSRGLTDRQPLRVGGGGGAA